jgi:elongation factor Ts
MAVDVKAIKELRERSGLGVMECKKALEESGGDLEKALRMLRQKGVTLAEKRAQRTTTAGAIGAYIHSGGRVGALVELCCETDFVARTEKFQQLLKDICMQVAAMNPQAISREQLPEEEVQQQREFHRSQIKDKPPQIVEKIVEGKLERFYYAEKCLLDQPFIKDEKGKTKVGELIKKVIAQTGENIVVRRFVRFELGGE